MEVTKWLKPSDILIDMVGDGEPRLKTEPKGRFGSTTDSEGCPQFRPLLGVQRKSISGGCMSVRSQKQTLAAPRKQPQSGL